MTLDDLGADQSRGDVEPVPAELDLTADGLAAGSPMVGIAIRLPVATLDAARLIAHDEGVKVTAMLREWIDQRVAERVDDARVVSVGDLRRLIAHRAHDLKPGRDVGGDELHVAEDAPHQATTAAGSQTKVAEADGPKVVDVGKSKGKSSAGAKAKGKGKGKSKSGHGSGKAGPKAG
ncbi:MAG: hypothetical protein ACOH17_01500 [Cellulomonas sp.]